MLDSVGMIYYNELKVGWFDLPLGVHVYNFSFFLEAIP